MWKFKNNENSTETAKKNSGVYGQGVIIDRQFSFWGYVKKRWTQTRTLIRPWSRCFKRIGEMQFTQLALDLATPQTYHLPPLKKDRKSEHPRRSVSYTITKQNKGGLISLVTSLLSRQRHGLLLKNINTGKIGPFMTIFYSKSHGLTSMNLRWWPQKQSFMEEKLYCMDRRITTVSFVLSFKP